LDRLFRKKIPLSSTLKKNSENKNEEKARSQSLPIFKEVQSQGTKRPEGDKQHCLVDKSRCVSPSPFPPKQEAPALRAGRFVQEKGAFLLALFCFFSA
jgi:hypothetical protein